MSTNKKLWIDFLLADMEKNLTSKQDTSLFMMADQSSTFISAPLLVIYGYF